MIVRYVHYVHFKTIYIFDTSCDHYLTTYNSTHRINEVLISRFILLKGVPVNNFNVYTTF